MTLCLESMLAKSPTERTVDNELAYQEKRLCVNRRANRESEYCQDSVGSGRIEQRNAAIPA